MKEQQECSARNLIRVSLDIATWDNRSSKHAEPLIHRRFVDPVLQAQEECVRAFQTVTLPNFPEGGRLLNAGVLFDAGAFSKFKSAFEHEVLRLQKNWQEAIDEARCRLGAAFNIGDYPSPEELPNKYRLQLERCNEPISTTSLLGKYSRFHREASICDAISWAQKLAEEMKKPPKERKTPDWNFD